MRTGGLIYAGSEEHDLPQLQSFRATVRRIQKKHVKVLPNYVLLHQESLI